MKLSASISVLIILLAATLVSAATPTFSHVVIVVQENRTPDNIFGSTPTFAPGVDIQGIGSTGLCAIRTPQQVPLMQNPDGLKTCYDLGHWHSSWKAMCDVPAGGSLCNMDMGLPSLGASPAGQLHTAHFSPVPVSSLRRC